MEAYNPKLAGKTRYQQQELPMMAIVKNKGISKTKYVRGKRVEQGTDWKKKTEEKHLKDARKWLGLEDGQDFPADYQGLTYGKDDFDLDRYQEIRDISAEMMAYKSDLPLQKVKDLFCNEIGYQTPKLGTRAAIFKDNKILLVQENDGSWSLPGGWCEVNMSVKENCIKEAKEESGLDIEVERVIGIYDQNKHSEAIYPYNVVHVFFLCKPLGGEFKKNIETTTRKYFAYDQLPENLSTDRNSLDEIEACFKAYKDPGFQVECD